MRFEQIFFQSEDEGLQGPIGKRKCFYMSDLDIAKIEDIRCLQCLC